jgi:hypothetical protein
MLANIFASCKLRRLVEEGAQKKEIVMLVPKGSLLEML